MAHHIVTIFCEGPHDVAFLVKILKAAGYKTKNGIKIGEFPAPYNDLLIKEAEKSNVGDFNIQELRRSLLPTEVIYKEDYYFFFYVLGGDGKKDPRQKLLKQLYDFMPEEEGEKSLLPENTTVTALYFFDADEKGVSSRLSEVSKEINEVIDKISDSEFDKNGTVISLFENVFKLGVYIFSNKENEKGDLEDILIPLMKKDNEKIFDESSTYLTSNFDENRLYPNKLHEDEGSIIEIRETRPKKKLKYDENKSLLGVVGQLQKSGSSNVVCIGQSDYLTLDKINGDAKCQDIVNFFNQVIK